MAWQLTRCPWFQRQRLNALLQGDWEPFAVEHDDVFLRRPSDRVNAGIGDDHPLNFEEARAALDSRR